ncbi:MAG: Ig-like domain repeat protein [Methanobrevibacter arboriphilus]|uniref:Ig-like domain repeat protein n=1 Tax=Methanobrevibacter arboriphilus TaxID=39441 RepID=A0A843AJM5_METAZ|nr:Ig-like domain repeat protein [Methanobrevibacter arboriphilus]MBF4469426.1 Ig-like domain repeat protein [Methanobrevibacter arboriphilus]
MKLKFVVISLLLVMFLSLGAASAASSDIYVSTNGSDTNNGQNGSPYATIDKAIKSSSENDNVKIHLSEGNFTGNGNLNLTIDKNHTNGGSLTIIGAGINKTFIDGVNSYNIFNIGRYSNVSLINLTIINGRSTTYGAISFNGTLNIENCSFENNMATTGSGGAIYSPGVGSEVLTVSNSFFSNNNATQHGGAIYAYALANITNSIFVNNYAGYSGGSVYNSGSSSRYSSISNCTFNDSTAGRDGGSLYITYASVVNNTFENSKTTGTSTSYGGGAICGGNIYLENNNMILCSAASGRGHSIKATNLINNTIVTINDKNITNPSFTLTATVTDDKGNLIDGGTLTFYVNSTSLGNGNVINGEATLNANELLSNGVYVISGSSTSYPNIANGTLNVNLNVVPSVYYVSPNGDDTNGNGSIDAPFKTLKKAIDTGFANGVYVTVYLLDGVYSGEGNLNLTLGDYLGNLDIIGLNYNKTIINGNGAGLLFNFGLNLRVNLVNLTVINFNNSTNNGAIILSNGTNTKYKKISIQDCIFENNNMSGNYGLIIKLLSGSVENSLFNNNTGSCVYIYNNYYQNDLVLVKNSNFTNNIVKTSSSRGIAYLGNNALLENCIFINNSINDSYIIYSPYILSSMNNQFINNTNSYNNSNNPGCIVSVNTAYSSLNDTFEGNYAAVIINGGGTVVNNTFRNNILSVGDTKSIFYLNNNYQLNITNCIFSDNNITNIIFINRGVVLNDVSLRFESINSTSLKNILRAYLDFNGINFSGGSVNFYIDGVFVGSASFVNNIAELNLSGYGNGIYEISGNSTNFTNSVSQKGILNISANQVDSLVIYVGENGSDIGGNGSIDNPFATIQKAIDTGVLNTLNLTIHILPGTIKGLGNVNLTLPGYLNLTIMGSGSQSIIDGESINWLFNSSDNVNNIYTNVIFKISNLKITNAKSFRTLTSSPNTGQVGIIHSNGKLKIDNCVFTNNEGYIISANTYGNLTLNNSYFTNNTGAVYAYDTIYVEILNTLFEGNNSAMGPTSNGGKPIIYISSESTGSSAFKYHTQVIINNITITGNIGNDTQYLGVYLKDGMDYKILNSKFVNNNMTAVMFFNTIGGLLTIDNCDFNNNTLSIKTSWSASVNPTPCITVLNSKFNNSGFWTYLDSRYQNVVWTVINSTFNNLTNLIFQDGGYHNGAYRESILDGNIFTNNIDGLIIRGNATIKNCVILDNLSIIKGSMETTEILINLNYNYWGNNGPNININRTLTTVIVDYWIVPVLYADNKSGLSQVIKLAYMAVDSENNTFEYDTSGIPIPIKEFTLSTNEGTISNISGNLTNNGTFTTIYNVNSYGNKSVLANFNDGSFLSLDLNFHKDVTSTNISLSNNTGKNGDYVDVTVDVTDSNGNPINDGLVEFFFSSESLGTVNVVNGQATKRISINGSRGAYEIYANYLGTENLNESSASEIYKLVVDTSISGELSNPSPSINDVITINATIISSDGSSVNNGIVNFYVNGILIGTSDVINGKASINWNVNIASGRYDVYYEYVGVSNYLNSNTSNFVNISNLGTSLTMSNTKGTYAKTTVLKATLKDINGKAIVGRYVKFYVNNKYVGQAKTNSQGLASLNYKVASTGSFTVKTTFASDNSYKNSSVSSKLSVPKLSKVKIKNSYTVKGKKITFKTLLANLGPDKSSLVISYKLPKGVKLLKRSLSSGLVKYNKRTGILSWTVKNLKLSKSKSAILTVSLSAKKGKYYIKNSVKKSAGSLVSGNNALKNIKVK